MPTDADKRARRAVVAAARSMVAEGLVVGTVGNVSARVSDGFAITPTRAPYHAMHPRDLVTLDAQGTVLRGHHEPSREWPLHAAVYTERPDVRAVVHTHSLHATAWSLRGCEPLPATEECAYYDLGDVSIAPAAPAGSPELAAGVARALGGGRAVLLAGHGVVTVGGDPSEALTIALLVERQAAMGWLLDRVGVPR